MVEKTLDELLKHLKDRWADREDMDKKTKVLIRQCLWKGANAPHLEKIGLPISEVIEIYHAMPDKFHEMRAKAVLVKHQKEKTMKKSGATLVEIMVTLGIMVPILTTIIVGLLVIKGCNFVLGNGIKNIAEEVWSGEASKLEEKEDG